MFVLLAVVNHKVSLSIWLLYNTFLANFITMFAQALNVGYGQTDRDKKKLGFYKASVLLCGRK
jgi:hypothetical protein